MTNTRFRRACLIPLMTLVAASAVTPAQSNDPKPEPAIPAILSAFDKYQVVAMNVGHLQKDVDDFILSLVRHPAFPRAANVIVLEGLNPLFQSTLDQYIAGIDVPISEVRRAWRTGSPIVWGVHDRLIPLVRAINLTLLPSERLRVVAAEPPIDMTLVQSDTEANRRLGARDASLTATMEKEVFARGRKALLLYGTFHLMHGMRDNAVSNYERTHPGVTLVIDNHSCRGEPPTPPAGKPRSAYAVAHDEIERRMKDWPVPSLAMIKGTWLAELRDAAADNPMARAMRLPPWSVSFDAYLYLGPSDRLLYEPAPAHVFADSLYMADARRIAGRWGSDAQKDRLDAAKMRERDSNPLFCDKDR